MYLYIFEDGEVKTATTFGESDRENCDDGILDVIDLQEERPRQYHGGEWHDIESADT